MKIREDSMRHHPLMVTSANGAAEGLGTCVLDCARVFYGDRRSRRFSVPQQFADQVERPSLDLVKGSPKVLSEHTNEHQLNATQEQNDDHH